MQSDPNPIIKNIQKISHFNTFLLCRHFIKYLDRRRMIYHSIHLDPGKNLGKNPRQNKPTKRKNSWNKKKMKKKKGKKK